MSIPSRGRESRGVITLWSRQFDGSKVDEPNGYCKNEVSKRNAGEEKPEGICRTNLFQSFSC